MVKIKWSQEAMADLEEIIRYIAQDSKYYAKIFMSRLYESVEHLKEYPEIGRYVSEADSLNVKELIYKGYRIIYQINDDDDLEIITVIHGSRLIKL